MEVNVVLLRAVSLLKRIINVSWVPADADNSENKENTQQNSTYVSKMMGQINISESDRNSVKQTIFQALFVSIEKLQNNMITKELENIFYNIAQTDFENNQWPDCYSQILECLSNDQEAMQLVGLCALKELVRAFKLEIHESRKITNDIGEQFLPGLEGLLSHVSQNGDSKYQMKMMILIFQIFHMINQLNIAPILQKPGKLKPWVDFIVGILENRQEGSTLEQHTEKMEEIE